jgi:hypothetical protein
VQVPPLTEMSVAAVATKWGAKALTPERAFAPRKNVRPLSAVHPARVPPLSLEKIQQSPG